MLKVWKTCRENKSHRWGLSTLFECSRHFLQCCMCCINERNTEKDVPFDFKGKRLIFSYKCLKDAHTRLSLHCWHQNCAPFSDKQHAYWQGYNIIKLDILPWLCFHSMNSDHCNLVVLDHPSKSFCVNSTASMKQ